VWLRLELKGVRLLVQCPDRGKGIAASTQQGEKQGEQGRDRARHKSMCMLYNPSQGTRSRGRGSVALEMRNCH